MKKVINGKMYNTETAKMLAEWESGYNPGDFNYYAEILYIKKTGEYFLYGEGGARSKYGVWHGNTGGAGEKILPLTLREAKEWAERHLGGREYEEIFGEIEETTDINEQSQQYSVLLPVSILDALKAKKEATGVNVSALIIKALREAGYVN